MTEHSCVEQVCQQIEFARNYTLSLLAEIDEADWFRQPSGAVTHIAWQVGHLASSQYLLTLFRMRGKIAEDRPLISKPFLRQFGKGSTPDPDPANNPSPQEIRAVLDGVHSRFLEEWPGYSDEDLGRTVIEPYAIYNTKLGSLLFCAHHEMLHAGQIGLIRRLLGMPPIR